MGKVYIHPTAEVSAQAKIGENTKIWHQAQIREGAVIGRNCKIGKSVYIDADVHIGNNVKIQNGVSVYKGVVIKSDVLLGPHVTFTNDLFPRAFNEKWEIMGTMIKKGTSIGANATIVCGVTINEYAMIGAGAVVTEDIPAHGLAMGNPARIRGFVCVCGQKLFLHQEKKNAILMRCKACGRIISIFPEAYHIFRALQVLE